MSRKLIRLLVVLSVLSIIGILVVQMAWVRRAYALRERQFQQTAFIALQDVARQVAELNSVTQNRHVVRQLSPDYFIVNTDSPINPLVLEYLIANALRKHALLTDFEYGIYDCSSDRMVYGAYVSSGQADTTRNRRPLPKFAGYTYYFGIRFPGQAGFLADDLDTLIGSSLAVLLVVIFFGYTLVVVLRQRRLTEVQRDFINSVTHELQTPVSTIRIAADVLHSEGIADQPDRLRRYAQILKDESLRLQHQIDSVLRLARTERLHYDLHPVPTDLHDTLTRLARMYEPSVTLQLEATRFTVLADAVHLENMAKNLLENALKYSPNEPHVVIRTVNNQEEIIWSVEDSGVGIPKAYQKIIFRQFYRIPDPDRVVKGFGLGLYYVKKIVDAHRWTISVHSEEGRGSTFAIHCPILRLDSPETAVTHARHPGPYSVR